ncbi:DUF2993 domain-containing protein [Oculatella sp. LEGE 06141]|uniref:LmeA family phospholipid-binding protein n=1 Tax=Oculatella sp. LEGE 06141 TaxID=1828648 RepID=UPI001882FA13|nr:DUF2993 domain-containing protein [Oculatella sp. LEGE 06141]MBE9179662.1 DUF2993 domain-containing protein [Oculatella sp. LEGE 06141]
MASGNPDMGEQALSKAAEVGMSSQLDEVESLDVDLRTDPGKLVQGELESAEIEGRGMVMQKDLRTEELTLKTNAIAIDPLKAAFGDIELKRPTDASAHVVLTEGDLERAFNAEYIQAKLRDQQLTINGESLKVSLRNVKFRIPEDNKVALESEVFIPQKNEKRQVAFTAVPRVAEGGNRVALEDIQYAEGQEVSPELTDALLNSAKDLLDLRNFELQGMSLQLQKLDVQKGKLVMQAQAHVEQFPG